MGRATVIKILGGARMAVSLTLLSASAGVLAQVPTAAPTSTPAPKLMAAPNPFVPPSQRIDRQVLERIVKDAVRDEVSAFRKPGGAGSGLQPNGMPIPPGLAGSLGALPNQPGMPGGVSTASGAGGTADAGGPVDELLKSGGRFVGCADGTPVFTDKEGRRVYFTTSEIQSSVAPKRMVRCPA